jgi:site-specific DNA recombinase
MSEVIEKEIRKVVAQVAPIRVVIYIRVSKEKEDTTSLGSQEREARVFAASNGWEVVKVCKDDGRSAYKRNVKRPAFDEAMRMIESKQASVFLVWKLNRFYRGLDEFNAAWTRIRNAGAELVSVTEPIYNGTDPMMRFAIMGFAAMAEHESRVKSDQSTSAHRVRLSEGRRPNGIRPFGYEKPNGSHTMKINEREAEFIRGAADRILNGESLRAVLRDTDLTGETGKPLTPRGLRFILTCPRTAGFRQDPNSGMMIAGQWEAIITPEKRDALIALFDDPSRMSHTSNQISHVLSGVMMCGKESCGGPMGSRTWKDGYRYQCRICGNSIDEAVADETVRMKVLDMCPQSQWESMKTQGHGFDPAIVEPLQARIDELTIAQLMETDARKRDLMQTAIDRLTQQVTDATEGDWLDLPAIGNLANEWHSMSLADVRTVIRSVASSITLAPVKGGSKNPTIRINVEGK